jgi:hypothetical protein
MKLRGLEHWDRLWEDDLNYSNVRQAESSQFLQEFQERLGRNRYIANNACAVLRCCRPFNFHYSRYIRNSVTLSSPVRRPLQRPWAHILRASSHFQRKPTHQN